MKKRQNGLWEAGKPRESYGGAKLALLMSLRWNHLIEPLQSGCCAAAILCCASPLGAPCGRRHPSARVLQARILPSRVPPRHAVGDTPADMVAQAEEYREQLVELAVEHALYIEG